MQEYGFTVVLDGIKVITEDVSESLYAIADDASACSSCGVATIHFDRESGSLEAAIRSALADVLSVGLRVKEVRQDKDDLHGLLLEANQ